MTQLVCGGFQFGMLIEYLFEEFPNWEEIGEQAIGDLQVNSRFQTCKGFIASCIVRHMGPSKLQILFFFHFGMN